MSPGPCQRSAAGRWHQARRRFYAGWRLRLTRPTFVRPAVNLFTIVAETAGADGLKIAETFPEGRGSLRGPRKRSAAGRSGSVPVVVPDGGINALSGLQEHTTRGPHRSLRQRRANVAYTGVTLASFASRVPR
ncbi:hypothetical protein IE992_08100 [Klebsiella pneumoniae]|uniref:Uncharacterized protein n=1 Tax=Klebsiella pneumoniae TaxID=573 RepID=A0A927E081_KLEPN|nr:hypothetical protein [Klebsiella pneumoniae]